MTRTKRPVGRPEKLTRTKVQKIVDIHNETGRYFKALAKERHIPYISLVVALKRHGLSPRAGKTVTKEVA